jgi:hypothetical protein
MNAQEIFDTAAIGVIRQGRPSMGSSGSCAYRGEGGAKCAAGFLLSDEVYDPSMDCNEITKSSTDWESTVVHFRSRLPQYLLDNQELITDLQGAHDAADPYTQRIFVLDFIARVTDIADSYGLSKDNVLKIAKELGYA